MIKNVKILIIYAFKSKFHKYFVFTKKLLHRFVSVCISLIFRYCLFVEKKMLTIKHLLLNSFGGGVKMCDKITISAHILKIVENDPFLRLQMTAKEMFNRHQFVFASKQYVKIKLVQNETNLWSGFLVKTKYF